MKGDLDDVRDRDGTMNFAVSTRDFEYFWESCWCATGKNMPHPFKEMPSSRFVVHNRMNIHVIELGLSYYYCTYVNIMTIDSEERCFSAFNFS